MNQTKSKGTEISSKRNSKRNSTEAKTGKRNTGAGMGKDKKGHSGYPCFANHILHMHPLGEPN